jgi:hypothetical protein
MYITSRSSLIKYKSYIKVNLIIVVVSNLFTRVYVSEANMLRVILLYLVKN